MRFFPLRNYIFQYKYEQKKVITSTFFQENKHILKQNLERSARANEAGQPICAHIAQEKSHLHSPMVWRLLLFSPGFPQLLLQSFVHSKQET